MKSGKKIFEFKGNKYDLFELVRYNVDYRALDYQSGEVTNTSTGECFDITEIRKNTKELNQMLMDNSEHLSYYERRKLRLMLSGEENAKIKVELEAKLDADTITLDELLVLMDIEGDDYGYGCVKISLFNKDFIKLNQKSLFPEELKDATLGKYLRLLMLTTYDNTLQNTNRANSKEVSKADLMKYLKINSETTWVSLFKELEKHKLLYRKEEKGKGFTIFINPIYANREECFRLDKTQYNLFKENLQDRLPKRICKYMEMINVDGMHLKVRL